MNIFRQMKVAISRRGAFANHLFVQSTGTIVSQLIPVAIAPILTRLFSPVDFGLYGTVVSVSALLAIFTTLRIDHGIMVAPTDNEARQIAQLALTLAAIGSLAFSILSLAVLAIAGLFDTGHVLVWAIYSPLAGMLAADLRILTLYANRLQRFKIVSRTRILQAIVVAVASLAFGYFAFRPDGLVLALLVGNLFVVVMLIGPLWPPVRPTLPQSIALFRTNSNFIRYSLPADLVNTLSSRLPFILFPLFFGLEQTGYLALAYRVIATPSRFIGSAIGEVYYSHAARDYETTGSCWPSGRKVASLLVAIGVPGFLLLFLIAEPLFVFVFGEAWRPAATMTQILVPMLLISFVVSPLSGVFYIAGRQKEDMMWQIAFLAATSIACFVGVIAGGVTASLIAFSAAGSVLYLIYFALIRRYAGGVGKDANER